MALNYNALVTLNEAKEQLDVSVSSAIIDARIERYINAASQMIETYLDRKIIFQTYDVRKDGRGSDRIILRDYPIFNVDSLWDDVNWEFDPLETITEYLIQDESVIVLKNRKFQKGNGNIRVVYSSGYQSPNNPLGGFELPSDLSYACLMTVEWLDSMRHDRRVGVSSKGKNGESISFDSKLPETVTALLDNYVRFDVPNSDTITNNW